MVWFTQVRKNSAVDGGVEGFHPAIKGLGEAGDLADIGDGNSRIPQLLCGRPGGDDIYPVSDQRLAEVNQPALVAHRHQCAGWHNAVHGCHGVLR